jgi:membrane-associated phospholipid phosphatase
MQTRQNASLAVADTRSSPRRAPSLEPAATTPTATLRRLWPWLLLVAALLVAGAIAAFNVDCSVAQWFCLRKAPRYLHDLATICELFGRGECVLLVVILIWRLDRARLWAVPGLAATALLSGLAADGVKMLIARVRPHHFDFLGGVWTSFGPWLPLGSLGSPNQSFPSAHTATAMGLAISLIVVYPAARGLFALAPLLVAYQRMDSGAHFLSDVLCGAAVGCIVAAITLRAGWLDRVYSERFWSHAATFLRLQRPRGNGPEDSLTPSVRLAAEARASDRNG